jgi:hypothetical protein
MIHSQYLGMGCEYRREAIKNSYIIIQGQEILIDVLKKMNRGFKKDRTKK